jgi:hypothetical protein
LVAPPAVVGLEDHALTEAGWHLQHRNQRLEAGDLDGAIGEERLLRTYFGAYLAAKRAQMPVELFARAAAVAADPSSYQSPVLAHRIWPALTPARLLAGALSAAVLLWLWLWPGRGAAGVAAARPRRFDT